MTLGTFRRILVWQHNTFLMLKRQVNVKNKTAKCFKGELTIILNHSYFRGLILKSDLQISNYFCDKTSSLNEENKKLVNLFL
jgi:hypothetical protein